MKLWAVLVSILFSAFVVIVVAHMSKGRCLDLEEEKDRLEARISEVEAKHCDDLISIFEDMDQGVSSGVSDKELEQCRFDCDQLLCMDRCQHCFGLIPKIVDATRIKNSAR